MLESFHFDLPTFIRSVGYLGVAAIVFAESGLLIGFFLPGDSLLFTAGFLASQGFLDVRLLCGLTFVCAVVGDSVGYAFGKKVGPMIFKREDSRFFHKDHLERAKTFYEKHGAKTIVIARFIPVIRTFAPIVAGVGTMRYRTFLIYNLIGGLLWAVGVTLIGYFFGSVIPDVDNYLFPIIGLIVFVSALPPLYHVWNERRGR